MPKRRRAGSVRWTVFVASVLVLVMAYGLIPVQASSVTVMLDTRSNYRAWQEAVIEEFEREYPHIKVDTWLPTGNPIQQIRVMLAGGTQPPDLAFHDPYHVIDFAREDLVVDLTPYFEKDAEQYADWLPSGLDFFRFRGGLYGLPQDLQIGAIFYNADAYSEAGLVTPNESWTYDDLLENARLLRRSDDQGVVIRHGFKLPTWRNWMSAIWAHGGDFIDSWVDPTRFTGHTAELREGLEYLKSLVDLEAVQDRQTHGAWSISAGFREQRVVMGQTNTVVMQNFRDIHDFRWDAAPLPTGPAGQVSFLNARGWFIMEASRNKDEAWELLKYFTSPKALKMLVAMVGGVPPSRSGVIEDWLASLDMPLNRHLLITGIETARSPGALAATVYDPIGVESHAFIWGDKPLLAALEDMERKVNAAIADLVQ